MDRDIAVYHHLTICIESVGRSRKAQMWYLQLNKVSNGDGDGDGKSLVDSRSTEDRYSDVGTPLMHKQDNGFSVLELHEGCLILRGDGASHDGDMPFLDYFNLTSKVTVSASSTVTKRSNFQ